MASQALHPLFITTILFLTGHTYVTCLPVTDLDDFLELYAGEFSNERQNSEDLANNITGPELHFLLRIFHVPVKVPVLDQAGVKTRQIYLEQYFNDGDAPTRQRIYNFKLQNGRIEMAVYQYDDAAAVEAWKGWRTNRTVFADIQLDLLANDPACNVFWTRADPDTYTTRTEGTACQFSFRGTQVYLESSVNVTEDAIVQDERFRSVSDDSVVAGTTLPYVFDRVGDIPPPPGEGPSGTCKPVVKLACILSSKRRLRRRLERTFPECFHVRCPQGLARLSQCLDL